jgi:hypothetical protein
VKIDSGRRKMTALVVSALVWTLSPLLPGAAQASSPGVVPSACSGVSVSPGTNLVNKVASKPAGTTFCIHAGTYSIGSQAVQPKDNDRLIGDPVTRGANGTISAPTKIVGTGPTVIDMEPDTLLVARDGVVIQNLDVSGAQGSTACKPKCGKGIAQGSNLTVTYSRIHNNMMSGIGGLGAGGIINHVEIDHNGSTIFYHCCAAGIKSVYSYTFGYSYVHDNVGNGVWQDGCGTNFKVTNSTVIGNHESGIRYEHNTDCPGSATITHNTVKNNNLDLIGGSGGIAVNSAPGANVGYNVLGGNKSAGIYVGGTRGPLTGTSIHDNTMNGDALRGCDLTGVTCTNNT